MKTRLTVREAALVVGLDVSAVYRWIRKRKLRTVIDGDGNTLVEMNDVLRVNAETRPGRPRIEQDDK